MSENAQNNPFHWLGLLRWSLAQHSDDYTTDAKPMSEEDKKWLSECMDTMVRDDAKHMKEILKKLGDLFLVEIDNSSADAKLPVLLDPDKDEEGQLLLEELEDVVCQIDMAQNFVKLKGLECLVELLSSNQIPPLTRGGAAGVMATLAQNNPPVQEAMLQAGYLVLLSNLLQDLDDDRIKVKCLGAMSCLIRSHAEAEMSFCSSEGPQLLQMLFNQPSVRLKRKVLFLASALLGTDLEPISVERVNQLWILVGSIVGLLKDETDVEIRENTLQMLINLCKQNHKERLRSSFGEDIDEAHARAQAEVAPLIEEDENAKKEMSLWQELQECFNTSNQNSNANSQQSTDAEQPILLLEPPHHPAAASPAP